MKEISLVWSSTKLWRCLNGYTLSKNVPKNLSKNVDRREDS